MSNSYLMSTVFGSRSGGNSVGSFIGSLTGNLLGGFIGGGASGEEPWYTLGKADDTDPSFWADFTNNRYAVNGAEEAFNNIFTFTRSTTGTYFDANGVMQTAAINAPRFDHNPSTGKPLGLLIEEQRSNICRYSDFSVNAVNGGTAYNSGTSPISAESYLVFTEDGSTGGHGVAPDSGNNTNFTSGTTYTLSVFIKRGSANIVQISGGYPFSTNFYANFDFTTGTFVSLGSAVTASSVKQISTDVYRLSITGTATASGGTRGVYVYLVNDNASATLRPSYTGTDKTVYMCGAQAEVGSFATSYIPTTSAAVTRGRDVCYNGNSNSVQLSTWLTQGVGTIFSDYISGPTTSLNSIFVLKQISTVNTTRVSGLVNGTSTIEMLIANAGSTQYQATISTNASYAQNKVTMAYGTNNVISCSNGSLGPADTSANIPMVLDQFDIGYSSLGYGTNVNGHIKDIRYYPIRVTNSEMVRITT